MGNTSTWAQKIIKPLIFFNAVCIEDSSKEKLTDWCGELEDTLKQLKNMSDVPGLHLLCGM